MNSTSDGGGRGGPEPQGPGRKPPPPAHRRLAWLGEDVRGQGPLRTHFTGSIPFPADVLERHGAVVLRPAEVTRLAGRPVPRSTAYRAEALLIPEGVAQDDTFLRRANSVLEGLGVHLVKPRPIADEERLGRYRDRLNDLPRPVRIAVNAGAGPRRIDAWQVLQTLRSSGTLDLPGTLDQPGTSVGLEHLLVGSAMVSIGGSPGAVEGSPGAVEGSNGPAVYLQPGTGGRVPVAMALAPPRPSPSCSRRRPVVAVLDTGVSPHPWLNGFVQPDLDAQAAVVAAEQALAATTPGAQILEDPRDAPFGDQDFVEDIDSHAGHSTFIAGLIRQVAPDARISSVRIMHPDGVVYEGDLLAALRVLRLRMEDAQAGGRTDGLVDVVSLSLGYFDERSEDDPGGVYTSALAAEIDGLAACGVLVVAAAGNYSTDRPFYPAAFAAGPPAAGPPVISVGAWNPNGSKALFSDDGQWVTGWALGAALVSTYPDYQGAVEPGMGQEGGSRQTLDTDDFSGGFAVWSGTSFAAPLLAAEIAELLFGYSEAKAELSLDVIEAKATINRIGNVLDALRRQE